MNAVICTHCGQGTLPWYAEKYQCCAWCKEPFKIEVLEEVKHEV